jgi:hypothetical protein
LLQIDEECASDEDADAEKTDEEEERDGENSEEGEGAEEAEVTSPQVSILYFSINKTYTNNFIDISSNAFCCQVGSV